MNAYETHNTISGETFTYQINKSGHRGSRAIQRLVEYAPASGGLALWMQHRDVSEAPANAYFLEKDARIIHKPWIVGNDGKTIFYGPAFTNRPLEEQTGLVAHQVLHVALRHVDREHYLHERLGNVDHELYNICADAIVNASLSHLAWLTLPKGCVQLNELLHHVLDIEQPIDSGLHQWDTESLYRAIDDRQAKRGGSGRKQQHTRSGSQGSLADNQQGEDSEKGHRTNTTKIHGATEADNNSQTHLQPGKDIESTASANFSDGPKSLAARQLASSIIKDLIPVPSTSPELRTEQSMQWSERLLRAHAADAEQSFMRQLLADNKSPSTPWEQILRTQMQRALSLQTDVNWSRPSRSWIANKGRTSGGHRLPWQPGTSYSRRAPRLCVLVDVSGSVNNTLMQRFSNEIDRILRTYRTSVTLIIGDDKVIDLKHLESGVSELRNINFNGGGGTDFRPLIMAATKCKPDMGVFLTDLEGPAGDAPAWPIIWATPANTTTQPLPFGRRIVLD